MLSVHIADGQVSVRESKPPRRPKGHALLRLVRGGICNTDLELLRGYYGFAGVPGHEFVAEVVESETPAWKGKLVVGEINLACGKCDWCARGLGRHCPTRTVLGIVRHPGAFQQFFTLPEQNLFAVPKNVAIDHAVFTEPIAAACEILDQVKIVRDEPVAVIGDGKLGLLIAQVLQLHGARVHHFGRHASKLRISAALGVKTSTSATLQRAKFDKVVEATGSADALSQAIALTRPRGSLVMKSTVHNKPQIDTAAVIVNEITLVGSRCGRFEPALKLLRSGRMNLAPMIAARFPLRDAPAAFAQAATRGTLKVLLDHEDSQ